MTHKQTITSLALTALLVFSAFVGPLAVAPGTASADIGEQGTCVDDVLGLLVGGSTVVLYDNYRDPCFANNDQMTDIDTPEEAKRVLATRALEDKRYLATYFDQFDMNTDRLENPAYLDAKAAFAREARNGTETSAVTAGREAVHNRTTAQQRALWRQYRSVLDSAENLEFEARDKNVRESMIIGHINSSGGLEAGYTLANWSTRSTVNVTLTNGEYIEVPAPYKADNGTITDRLHPLNDDVVIAVYNPENNQNVSVVNNWTEFAVRSASSIQMGEDYEYPNPGSSISELSLTLTSGSNTDAKVLVGESNSLELRNGGTGDVIVKENNTKIAEIGQMSSTSFTLQKTADGTVNISVDGSHVVTTSDTHSLNTVRLRSYTGSNAEVTSVTMKPETAKYDFKNQFKSSHTELEAIDDRVISALGNESSGYFNNVYNNVQMENINWSDIYTPNERYRMSVESSDVGEQGWLAYQYNMLGYGGANVSDTVEVTIQSGAVVDGTTISSEKTVSGQLFTAASPPNGEWVSGSNYTVGSSGDLTSTVYVLTTSTTQTTQDGTITFKNTGKTIAIESGTFTVSSITNSDGDTVEKADHTTREPKSTDISKFTEQIDELQKTIEALRQQIDEDNDGNNESGAAGGDSSGDGGLAIDLGALGSFVLPFASASVSIIALVIVGGVGLYLLVQFGPLLKIIASMFGSKK